MSTDRKRLVVLGGGFGGLTLVRSLKSSGCEILLLDKENHHLFQPLLYQVAASALAAPNIAQPLRSIFRNRPEVETRMSEAIDIDLEAREVLTRNRRVGYDYLVIALGSQTNYFGNDTWEKYAIGLKTLADAHRIRNRVLSAFERAENSAGNPKKQKHLMTTVIVGAGPTGVELAGTLAELSKRLFKKDFRNIHPESSRVVLVDAVNLPLPAYSESTSRSAKKQLESLGVELITGSMVKDIRDREIQVGEQIITAENIIWTAGVSAHPITEKMDTPKAKGGRLEVKSDCSLPQHPEVFAIGDIAAMTDANGTKVPGVAPAAMQMAKHVSSILEKELANDGQTSGRPDFVYKDKGNLATIGRSRAVAEIGKLKVSGFPAWFLWLAIHLILLMGMRNRLVVLMQWFFAYVRNKPGARILWNPHH
ncbi:MAG: NAD(P)/FAD-dependent oxidoreductase [Verrucomicrobiae bacterium]|nr:NAD(P)/FAD-dependent oxidoreductase [Verrucomicrobiae bacterium]